MNSLIFPIATVTAIGVICAVMLSVASKIMAVEVDERAEQLRAFLPGANCGACGFAGCDGYAAALISDAGPTNNGGGVKSNLCTPGGPSVSRAISALLGLDPADVVTKVAILHCGGDCTFRQNKMEYAGIQSCAASGQLFGGQSACPHGCIGLGDCAHVCPNHAITIINGIARIDSSVCTGCGLCARTCPNRIITLESDSIMTAVICASPESGAATRKICGRGCIACGRCKRECPASAITVEGNLARIDYGKCDACGHCSEVCPVHCIQQTSFAGIFQVPSRV